MTNQQNKNIAKLVAAVLAVGALGYAIYANAAGSGAEAAAAAPKTNTASFAPADIKGDAWLVRCNDKKPEEVTEKRGKCEIFQQQTIKESGQRLVEFAIGFPAETKEARGILILPLGIQLQKDVSMSLDGGDSFNVKIRYCLENGCFAYMSLTDEVLAKMKKAGKATVGIESADGRKINLELPLTGFGKALDQVS